MARMGSNGHVRGTVLVVEDEHTIADVVARYLTRAGYTTRVAHDGPDALAAVAAQRPDLMVLDVMLPGLDGLEVGDLRVEPAARSALRGGEELALTVREFDLLLHLARHPGRAFTRDQLMDAVWRFSFYTDTATVTVHVRRLRAKLEEDPSEPRWLQTVWGVGYR